MSAWWCESAWLPDGPVDQVRLVELDGLLTSVEPGAGRRPDDVRLDGLVLPGFANVHSHAFHRALRGRTHDGGGTFWTWRQRMYALAARLDPDTYLAVARAAYAEMALAGVTAVGEFHYLHHGPGGRRYDEENVMGAALAQAAADAGVRLTLLDTCYLAGGLDGSGHLPLDAVQQRFSDGDADGWASRAASLRLPDDVVVGAAVHSVRAVPVAGLPVVADAARGRPLHVHLSEQASENTACRSFYGATPTSLLDATGVLGDGTTAVHATHVSVPDVAILTRSGTGVCLCPSTEADLADGIGPFAALRDAGVPLSVGSDQHVVTDLLAEARLVEGLERLARGRRGGFAPAELVAMLTRCGHDALGRDGGRIAVGAPADLVAVSTDSVRTAGVARDQLVTAATASDVHTVVVGGRSVVQDGRHRLGDVGRLLAEAVDPLWE